MSIANIIFNLPIPLLNHWGYWIVFLAAILEANPITGLIVPGMTLVIFGGFLSKLGILDLGDVIILASLGAIIGDLIGYYLGKKYGYSFITKYGKYFFFKKEYFIKTKKLMNNHTGKSLIIGRFNPLTRAFAPFIAGLTDVSFIKFLAYNILGGISWAVSFVLIGFIFGESYEVASKYIGRFIFIAIILSILIIYSYKYINKIKHIFSKKYFYILIINILSLYLFFKVIEDIVDREFITKLDFWINTKIVLLWNPLLNKIMIFITNILSPLHFIIILIIFAGFLIYKKKWYYSLFLFFGLGAGLSFESIIKIILQRVRPENALIKISEYSFPSGHATVSIIFFSILLYSFKEDIKNKVLKNIFIISNIIIILLIGFSRIYLNVHWFSDVIGGFSLGLFLLTLLVLIFKIVKSSSKNILIGYLNSFRKLIFKSK